MLVPMDLVPDLHLKENLSITEDTEATEDGRKSNVSSVSSVSSVVESC